MRVAVHDFSGHPFQVQLSRELARRSYEVLHVHCPSYVSGKGALRRTDADPANLAIDGIPLGRTFEKYSPIRRFRHERAYGRRAVERLGRFKPDVVVSSNTPLFAQKMLFDACRSSGTRFIFWQQDIYSLGMQSAVAKLPVVGRQLGRYATNLEGRLLAGSDEVVSISEDFLPTLREWGVSDQKVHVIHNWAPLEELPQIPRDNAWSRQRGLTGKTVLLYSGTLGRKHNPGLLLQLALELRDRKDVVVVVASEGVGSDWLRNEVSDHELGNLEIVGFQPYERMAEVLATGDILLLILEEHAGIFSVPSKMLSYQCAGRPLLASVPPENLSSRLIAQSECGIVVNPDQQGAFVDSAIALIEDGPLRHRLGANGRRHAEETFDIRRIGDDFDRILTP